MLTLTNGSGHGYLPKITSLTKNGLDPVTSNTDFRTQPIIASTYNHQVSSNNQATAKCLSDFSDTESDENQNTIQYSSNNLLKTHHPQTESYIPSHILPSPAVLHLSPSQTQSHTAITILWHCSAFLLQILKIFVYYTTKYLVILIRFIMKAFSLWYRRSWKRHVMLCLFIVLIVYFAAWLKQSRKLQEIPDIKLDEGEIDRQLSLDKKPQIVTYNDPKKKKQFFEIPVKEVLGANSEVDESVIEKIEEKRKLKYHRVWQWADRAINSHELFPDTPDVETVIEALQTAPIVNVDVLDMGLYESGTSEKWIATLEGGQKAIIKLIWEKDSKGRPKARGECNFGHEMPSSEIAAFHLLRLLGMRNTPYVVGRKVHIAREILPVAAPGVAKQILFKEGNQTCVKGQCYHCKTSDLLCPKDGMVETSIAYWIPRHLKLLTYPHDYMPYSTPSMKKEWGGIGFNNKTYCKKIQDTIHPYEIDRYYHDLFDFAVVDTLMYHYDTKHYLIYDHSEAHGLSVRLDHGRAFCSMDRDEFQVFLAPLTQCCTLRWSTYLALDAIRKPGELSKQLKHSLMKDPLWPILKESWYESIERRLKKVLEVVEQCAQAHGELKNILVG